MFHLLKKQSMRARLLTLVFISFVLVVAGLGTGVIIIQKKLLNQMEGSVAALLKSNNTKINEKFAILGKEVTNSLNKMPKFVGTRIIAKTTNALNKEKDIIAFDFEMSLKNNMESLAALLAEVAPAAILSNDFSTLISYVKSASLGRDVVYVIFLKPDGRPLTRYYNKNSIKIKKYIKNGSARRKINKILEESRTDKEVMIIKKPVKFEQDVLATVLLCVTRQTMNNQLKSMDKRFIKLIKSNDKETTDTLNLESKKITEQFSSMLNNISESNSTAVKNVGKEIRKSIIDIKKQISNLLVIISIISIVTISTVLFFVISKITRQINNIAGTINTGSIKVAGASDQVSTASRNLAESTANQAAFIQETSASMEEISSMTKINAENAGKADSLMKNADETVSRANASMDQLIRSMQDISKASSETSKIINTIDEIAFQTNLLALNAAVEAARAGEAGAGFAVVADEVRNLAMGASEAAKNTAGLIEDTVKRIDNGVKLVSSTNEVFNDVITVTNTVGQLVGSISSASREQAEGIEQINRALIEMDSAIQKNAASSQESAGSSEEMNAQSATMIKAVEELVAMVHGVKSDKVIRGFD